MTEYLYIQKCSDLKGTIALDAIFGGEARMRALLDRLETVCRPGEGAGKILAMLLAVPLRATWLRGRLQMQFTVSLRKTCFDLYLLTNDRRARLWRQYLLNARASEFWDMFQKLPEELRLHYKIDELRVGSMLTKFTVTQIKELQASPPPPTPLVAKKSSKRPPAMPQAPPPTVIKVKRQSRRPPPPPALPSDLAILDEIDKEW